MGPSRGPRHQPLAVHEPSPALPETLSRPDPAGLPSPTPVSWRPCLSSPLCSTCLRSWAGPRGTTGHRAPSSCPSRSDRSRGNLASTLQSGAPSRHVQRQLTVSFEPGALTPTAPSSPCVPRPAFSLGSPWQGVGPPPAEGRSLGECVARVKTKGDRYGFGEILSGCAASSLLPPTWPPAPQNQGEFVLPAHPSIPRPTTLLSEALRMPPVCACPSYEESVFRES